MRVQITGAFYRHGLDVVVTGQEVDVDDREGERLVELGVASKVDGRRRKVEASTQVPDKE